MRDVEKLLKLDPTNVELLQQRERLLAQASEAAAQKVDTLKQAIESANEAAASGNSEMQLTQSELDGLNRELIDAQNQFKNYKDKSIEAAAAMGKFQQGAEKVAKAADTVFEKTKIISAAAAGIVGYSANAAMELEATEAKFKTVFGEYTDDAQAFIDKFQELTPASEAQARALASGLQDLLVPMGFARDEATGLTGKFMTVIGALTDFNSATESAESVTNKVAAALTGEYTGLKSLGIQLDSSTVKQKAVDRGLAATTGDVTKQQEALILLLEMYSQSGDALAAYNEESLDAKTKMELLKASITDSAAALGESLLPFITQLLESLKGVIDAFNSLSPASQEIIIKIIALAAVLAPMAKIVSSVSSGIGGAARTAKTLAEKVGTLSTTMDPVYVQFAKWAAIIVAVTLAVTALIAAIATLTGKGGQLSETMKSISGATSGGNVRNYSGVQGFASGGVFMPNSPVLGILGDNTSEREIAAPESTLRDVFNQALDDRGGGAGGVNITF